MTTALDGISAGDILAGLPNRISKVIAPHIADRPAHPAFVEAGRSWSYGEFGGAVGATTADLARLKIRLGDRVLLASENSVTLAALIFACSQLDAWPVVVNPRLSPRELEQIYTHSGARRSRRCQQHQPGKFSNISCGKSRKPLTREAPHRRSTRGRWRDAAGELRRARRVRLFC